MQRRRPRSGRVRYEITRLADQRVYSPLGGRTPALVMAAFSRAMIGASFWSTALPTARRWPRSARSAAEKDTAVMRGRCGGRPGRFLDARKETIRSLYYRRGRLSIHTGTAFAASSVLRDC